MPVHLTCSVCASGFRVDPHRALTARYCSRGCSDASKFRLVDLVCAQCNASFKSTGALARAGARFCSRRCSADAQRLVGCTVEATPDGLTALVPLYSKGSIVGHAIVDANRADWASQWRWALSATGYAVRSNHGGRPKFLTLHRELLDLPHLSDGRHVDHISGDILDNQFCNLRIVTHAQNMQNMKSNRGSSSQYRGVGWDKSRNKWVAYVQVNGKLHNLGRFTDEREAAEVVRAARERLFTHNVE